MLTGMMRVVQVLLAAGDTFRAAAAEQLQLWAGRSGVAVHAATREKARPDNVLYEAVSKVSSGDPVTSAQHTAWQRSTGFKSSAHSRVAMSSLES